MEFMVNHVGGDMLEDEGEDFNVDVKYIEVDAEDDQSIKSTFKTESKKRKTACRITVKDKSISNKNVSVALLSEA